MDLFYVESGYLESGYLVYTADAQISMTTVSSLHGADLYAEFEYIYSGYVDSPVRGSFVKPGTASVTSTASVSVTAKVTRQSSASMLSVVTETATAGTIKSGSISMAMFGSTSMSATGRYRGIGDFNAVSSMSAQAHLIHNAGAGIQPLTWDDEDYSWDDWLGTYWTPTTGIHIGGNSNLIATPRVTGGAFINIQSVASLSALPGLNFQGNATVTSTASLTTIAGYRKITSANLSSTASQTVSCTRTRPGSADLSSSATVSATATVKPPIRGTATLASQAQVSTVGGYLKSSAVSMSAEFTFFAVSKIPGIQQASATLNSASSFAVVAKKTSGARATLASALTTTVSAVKTARTSAVLTSAVTQTANSTRIRTGLTVLSSLANVTAINQRVRLGLSQVTSNFSVLAAGGQTFGGTIHAQAISTVSVNAGRLLGGSANLQVSGFVLTVGDIFWVDPDYILHVPMESKIYPVLSESRVFNVAEETRVNIVLEENRYLNVPEETRDFKVIA